MTTLVMTTRLLAAALLAAPLLAGAATVTFDFRAGGGFHGTPVTLETGGLSLTVGAAGDRLFQNAFHGFGDRGPEAATLVGPGEMLSFHFGETVRLAGAAMVGRPRTTADLQVGGDGQTLGQVSFTHGAGTTGLDWEGNGWLGSAFTFAGLPGGAGFGVAGLTVSTLGADNQVGAVPLPPAAWLLAAGMVLLAALGRRDGPSGAVRS